MHSSFPDRRIELDRVTQRARSIFMVMALSEAVHKPVFFLRSFTMERDETELFVSKLG